MSLPRYIVNMEEGLPYIQPDFSGENIQTSIEEGQQRSKGFMFDKQKTIKWIVDRPILITGIKLSTNKIKCDKLLSFIGDSVNIHVENTEILDNRYIFYQDDYISFRSFQAVNPGSIITLEYNSDKKDNILWVDIDYVADPLLQEVNITHLDIDSGVVLNTNTLKLSKGKYTFKPKCIEGYIQLNKVKEIFVAPVYGDNNKAKNITFNYERS